MKHGYFRKGESEVAVFELAALLRSERISARNTNFNFHDQCRQNDFLFSFSIMTFGNEKKERGPE